MNRTSFDCIKTNTEHHLKYVGWNWELFLVYREYVIERFAFYHSL